MGIFPEILPCIVIKEIKKETFEVSTMQGLDQGLGGKRYTAEYCLLEDRTKRKTIDIVCTVMGYACIHGIRCLGFKESLHVFGEVLHELTQYIVATDTHIKTIAAFEEQGGVQVFQTFKDDDFNKQWGIGVDHCGMNRHSADLSSHLYHEWQDSFYKVSMYYNWTPVHKLQADRRFVLACL